MSLIRYPAVAGKFYPADPQELTQMLDDFLIQTQYIDSSPVPKAIIVPHAGYIYSGACAASAYSRLKPDYDKINRVILLGPSHRIGFKGLAVSHAEFFKTPLADTPIDTVAVQSLTSLPFVHYLDEAHYLEHSLEVQLPFLQRVLQQFTLIPIVVGDATAEQVSQVIELFYDEPQTLIVISSDLSHYHDYATARRLDQATSEKIEALNYQALDYESACGRIPLSGLLALAAKKSLTVKNIALCNSGDTAGDKERVVGYGSYVIH